MLGITSFLEECTHWQSVVDLWTVGWEVVWWGWVLAAVQLRWVQESLRLWLRGVCVCMCVHATQLYKCNWEWAPCTNYNTRKRWYCYVFNCYSPFPTNITHPPHSVTPPLLLPTSLQCCSSFPSPCATSLRWYSWGPSFPLHPAWPRLWPHCADIGLSLYSTS